MEHEQDVLDAWSQFKVPLGPRPFTWEDHCLAEAALEARGRLIVHYHPLVKQVAAKEWVKLQGHVDQEDLASYGMFGLMDAMEKYDASREVKFEIYARPRIKGQIYDELRKIDWIPRNVRTRARDLETAREEIEGALGRPASHFEVADHLGLPLADYWRASDQSQVSLVPLVSEMVTSEFDSYESTYNSAELDRSSNPEDHYEINQLAGIVSNAVAGLDERLKMILALYYLQDLTLVEIGEMLGVTGGRVCQLQSRALAELHDVIGALAA